MRQRSEMPTVFLNGSFLSRDEAMVSAFDAGLQHGVGLFETMLAITRPGASLRVIHAKEHLDRLAASARALALSESIRVPALEEAVVRTATRASQEAPDQRAWRIRLTITGGDLNLLEQGRSASAAQRPGEPTVLIVASPATAYPAEMFERGVSAVIADWRANPLDSFQGHKTLNYWPRLRELQMAATKRAGEALIFQVTNHLAGGCVSNAFVVKDGRLLTPIARGEETTVASGDRGSPSDDDDLPHAPLAGEGAAVPSPVLPGVTRRWVMDWANARGMDVERRMISISDVLSADEVFLTNSSWGVLPVVRVERERIGSGEVGGVSRELLGAWATLIAGE